jgi:hypothetical protein
VRPSTTPPKSSHRRNPSPAKVVDNTSFYPSKILLDNIVSQRNATPPPKKSVSPSPKPKPKSANKPSPNKIYKNFPDNYMDIKITELERALNGSFVPKYNGDIFFLLSDQNRDIWEDKDDQTQT